MEFFSEIFPVLSSFFINTAIFWFFLILAILFWELWRRYLVLKQIFVKTDWVLLELVLPKEIYKTPQAMEIVLMALNQKGAGNWLDRFLKGTYRTWFSLELVSLEGQVHFFIRTKDVFSNLIMSEIYAQYPEVEIKVVEDYMKDIDYDKEEKEYKLWGMELKLVKEDPYPIKTYVDYGLNQESLKEEQKTDPITPTIEFLGSLDKGEYAFIQILVMATKDRYKIKGKWFKKQGWKDEGKAMIKELMEKKGEQDFGVLSRSPGEVEVIKAIERNISKVGFDCGIRGIYMTKVDDYKKANQMQLKNSFQQYGALNLNGFKSRMSTSFDFIWQDPLGRRLKNVKQDIFNAYKTRSYFYPPFKRTPFVLNAEELATIFHIPGGVVTTPTLERIESKKAQPPANLPI
jgi:hypothetical protein